MSPVGDIIEIPSTEMKSISFDSITIPIEVVSVFIRLNASFSSGWLLFESIAVSDDDAEAICWPPGGGGLDSIELTDSNSRNIS